MTLIGSPVTDHIFLERNAYPCPSDKQSGNSSSHSKELSALARREQLT